MAQLLSIAIVVTLEMVFWNHWGPLLPIASMLVATAGVFYLALKRDTRILESRLLIYGTDATCVGVCVFAANVLWGSSSVVISVLLALGAFVGTLVCCACAGDLAQSLLGLSKENKAMDKSHFRDWPSD